MPHGVVDAFVVAEPAAVTCAAVTGEVVGCGDAGNVALVVVSAPVEQLTTNGASAARIATDPLSIDGWARTRSKDTAALPPGT